MSSNMMIRLATEQDAEALLSIYSTYVTKTAITFEYDIPSIEEFQSRIKLISERYPYLVLEQHNQIVGYAYASTFKARAAYDWAVETTIYLDEQCKGNGLGRQLYTALENVLKHQNIINLNACITYQSLPYVSEVSEAFHAKLGYNKVAHFTKCGYKFDRWFDVIWMEKFINEHIVNPVPFIPIRHLQADVLNTLLQ